MRSNPLRRAERGPLRRALAAAAAIVFSAFGLVALSQPASAAIACEVDYTVQNQWNTGFTASVTISNLEDPVDGWTLQWDFQDGQQVTNGWSGSFSQQGSTVTVDSMSWNASLASGASVTFGFNGTHSGTNGVPSSFTLNGTVCDGTSGGGTEPPGGGGGTQPPGDRVDNPYAGADVYVNPDWSAQAEEGGAPPSIYNQPTGVWLDRIAAIESGSAGENTMGLEDHLNEAVAQDEANGDTPLVFQVVIYNLPGRDCAALASNGELGPEEIDVYMNDYIDVIAGIMDNPEYADLRIVPVIEIDSLPNLVTNVSPRETATELCDTMLANGNYQEGVAYAVSTLGDIPNVYNYIDAAHHGWIGWGDTNPEFDNFNATAEMMASIIGLEGATADDVHGFITNTANYSALEEPFIDINGSIGGMPINQSDWIDFNDFNAELPFAQAFRDRLVEAGFNSGIGMLIDTSRNGWGGPERPTGPSDATEVNQFVDESRIDRRIHKGNWCNQAGAGLGERPQANPEPEIDAYVWIKPPGESDGSSEFIENDEGKGFDRMCDPTYGGNARNGNSMSGALPNAPLSGHWFQAQFDQLLENANPPVQ